MKAKYLQKNDIIFWNDNEENERPKKRKGVKILHVEPCTLDWMSKVHLKTSAGDWCVSADQEIVVK